MEGPNLVSEGEGSVEQCPQRGPACSFRPPGGTPSSGAPLGGVCCHGDHPMEALLSPLCVASSIKRPTDGHFAHDVCGDQPRAPASCWGVAPPLPGHPGRLFIGTLPPFLRGGGWFPVEKPEPGLLCRRTPYGWVDALSSRRVGGSPHCSVPALRLACRPVRAWRLLWM